MILAQRLLLNFDGALVKWFGFQVLPLRSIKPRQVVEALSGVQMISAQRLLLDGQRALIKLLCLNIVASATINAGQTINDGADVTMFSPQKSFTNLQRAFSQRERFIILAFAPQFESLF